MNEDEIIKRLKNIIEINKSFLNCDIQENSNIYKDIQGLLDLYQKEKERAENHKQLYLMEKDYQENKLSKYLIDKICERKFELQQEYKDFEDDIRLNTLEEIHKELLEERKC